MSHLLNLPNELLLEIAKHLQNPLDVYYFLLTSRHLSLLLSDLLFDFAVRPDANDSHAIRVLYKLASGGRSELVTKLITRRAKRGHDRNDTTPLGFTLGSRVLHLAVSRSNRMAVEQLLRNGVDINGFYTDHMALHSAVIWRKHDMVRFLLSKGATISAQDLKGRTALSRAAKIGDKAMTIILLEMGADIFPADKADRTPIHYAATQGHEMVVQLLLDHPSGRASIDYRDRRGRTALHVATRAGRLKVVETLLKSGANANARDSIGRMPIHLLQPERIEIFRLLNTWMIGTAGTGVVGHLFSPSLLTWMRVDCVCKTKPRSANRSSSRCRIDWS